MQLPCPRQHSVRTPGSQRVRNEVISNLNTKNMLHDDGALTGYFFGKVSGGPHSVIVARLGTSSTV